MGISLLDIYNDLQINLPNQVVAARVNYKVDINQASFIYIGTSEDPDKETFEKKKSLSDEG